MPQPPLISVIVPVYRAEHTLRSCVDSVLRQTYPQVELILIDDGSPDACPALCDDYAAADARVRVLHQVNRGLSAARNAGISAASGAYLSFLDADDWVEPDYLSYLFGLLEQHSLPLAACNHFVTVNGKDIPKFPLRQTITRFTERDAYEGLLYHQPPDASAWGKLYARSLFSTLRYPEGALFEDTWLIADLLCASGGVVYGAEAKYHYVFQPDSLSKKPDPAHRWDYPYAVERMSGGILAQFPDLEAACLRRRVHAALSVRRLLNHKNASDASDIAKCEDTIRSGASRVLCDRRAPLRDKAAILLALSGRGLFDWVWGLYGKLRKDY